jgi:hypothetical protein
VSAYDFSGETRFPKTAGADQRQEARGVEETPDLVHLARAPNEGG